MPSLYILLLLALYISLLQPCTFHCCNLYISLLRALSVHFTAACPVHFTAATCTFHCCNPVHFTAATRYISLLQPCTFHCCPCTFHCCPLCTFHCSMHSLYVSLLHVLTVQFNCCMPCTFHCYNTVHFTAARRVLQTVRTRCACSLTSSSCTRCRTAPCHSSAGRFATPTAPTPGSAAPPLSLIHI